mmetsp:Transcript_24816/g.52863  ORF Transcript_24816/g.52863 Transcript_24816/m.52863 type:complete len:274 (-) Transcript_24816:269-1090(-)
MKTTTAALFLSLAATSTNVVAFQQPAACHRGNSNSVRLEASIDENNEISRRGLFTKTVSTAFTAASVAGILNSGGVVAPHSSLSSSLLQPEPASAIGPVKINLLNPTYTAIPCPKDRPIPGEKAMKGMRGLCVTVDVDLEDKPERPLDKIGVYGYITDKGTGESVLANNPDGGTDAGQFAMIEKIETSDQKVQFEFIAAVPSEMDLTPFDSGIAPLTFKSLRVVSFPGGQQYGSISPCEMNEFSDECDAWEAENGPYEKKDYMVKSNARTKGR